MMALVYGVMRYTRFGLIARATMQNPAHGRDARRQPGPGLHDAPSRIGAAITGLAGGLLAPVSGVTPGMGGAYVAKAFITVVGGGAAILSGTLRQRACSASSTRSAPISPRRSMARSSCSSRPSS